MWVKCAHKKTLQHAFSEACLVEKDMYGLKDNPNHEPKRPSTSKRRQYHVPRNTTLDKYPYKMNNIKKLLQGMSNDIFEIKRENGDKQGNNKGQVRPLARRPYQHHLNQPPPNLGETLTSDEI